MIPAEICAALPSDFAVFLEYEVSQLVAVRWTGTCDTASKFEALCAAANSFQFPTSEKQ
jgi:hypothetical protein